MRVFLLVMVILGSFLGAGFASGKEIVTYFSRFGGASYIGIAFCTITFILLLLFFFRLSHKVNGVDGLISRYFGRFGVALKVIFSICILVLISTMFSGAWALGNTAMQSVLFILATAIIVFLCNYFGFGGIGVVNGFLVPIMIGMLLCLCLGKWGEFGLKPTFLPALSGITYVFINMLTLGVFVLEVGHKYSRKEGMFASIICGVIIGVLLFVCNGGILSLENMFCNMPMLEVARTKSQAVFYASKIVVWFALLTSIISNIYVLDGYLSGVIRNKFLRLTTIILLSILLSFLGLDVMVRYMYLIIGVSCLMLVLVVSVGEVAHKKRRIGGE